MREEFNYTKYKDDAAINLHNLENELATITGKIAFYGAQYALWDAEARKQKVLRDNRASELYIGYKHNDISYPAAVGKVTEGYIEAQQKRDETYQAYDVLYAHANTQSALYQNAVFNLGRKHDSLRSLNRASATEQDATNTYIPSRSSAEERAGRKARIVDAQR